MAEPTLAQHSSPEWESAPEAGAEVHLETQSLESPVLSQGSHDLRRMRYFRDLLEEGYRHALRPDLLSRSLRTERIALGIDLPELDTVALWSTRTSEGTVSIPFIEFILAEVGRALDSFCEQAPGASPAALEELGAARRELASALRQVNAAGAPECSLPRLSDVFVHETLLERVCGAGRLLDQLLRQCERLLSGDRRASRH